MKNPLKKLPLEERLRIALPDRPDKGCWPWRGLRDGGGYGKIMHLSRYRQAHVLLYELSVGLVPTGLELDHLCRNRACCNPAHLEPVTPQENKLRSARKPTHCIHGHEYTPNNTYLNRNKRTCRTCARERGKQGNPNTQNKDKTHCPHGHALTGENLYIPPSGGRRCRTCARARMRTAGQEVRKKAREERALLAERT